MCILDRVLQDILVNPDLAEEWETSLMPAVDPGNTICRVELMPTACVKVQENYDTAHDKGMNPTLAPKVLANLKHFKSWLADRGQVRLHDILTAACAPVQRMMPPQPTGREDLGYDTSTDGEATGPDEDACGGEANVHDGEDEGQPRRARHPPCRPVHHTRPPY